MAGRPKAPADAKPRRAKAKPKKATKKKRRAKAKPKPGTEFCSVCEKPRSCDWDIPKPDIPEPADWIEASRLVCSDCAWIELWAAIREGRVSKVLRAARSRLLSKNAEGIEKTLERLSGRLCDDEELRRWTIKLGL